MRRLIDWGADAVKVDLYYSPFDDPSVNDVKHAFIERIGAECECYEIPFFLEFVGYDPKGGDEQSFEYARPSRRSSAGAWRSSPSRSTRWTS